MLLKVLDRDRNIAIAFIKDKLSNWVDRFGRGKDYIIEYYYSVFLEAHYILTNLYNDSDFMGIEKRLILEFARKFPKQEIVFMYLTDYNRLLIGGDRLICRYDGGDIEKVEVCSVFSYEMDVDCRGLTEGIGKDWAVVEEIMFPESFVSSEGDFIVKIEDNEGDLYRRWLLVKVNNIEVLEEFLKCRLSYGKFLSLCSKFFIVREDLNNFKMWIEGEENFEGVKEKLGDFLEEFIFVENRERMEKILRCLMFQKTFFKRQSFYKK